jgi:hypothetical protein
MVNYITTENFGNSKNELSRTNDSFFPTEEMVTCSKRKSFARTMVLGGENVR